MSKTPAEQILHDVFGFEEFRGQQKEVIEHVTSGGNALLLMPTGMGKSLCYQIPARLGNGVTLVISPLIALMKDQVDQALQRGFRCCFINSSLSSEERKTRYQNLARGKYELVYVTPERFQKEEFRSALSSLNIDLLAIDEAHCVSEWGHDFRPDYTRISEFRSLLGNPPTLALTATATPEVQQDIIRQSGFSNQEVRIFDHGLERKNLFVSVESVYGIDEKLDRFLEESDRHPGSTIVYFSLIRTLEEFSQKLSQKGVPHLQYHGRLSDRERKRNQNRFMKDQVPLILATNAFGLGVDKPDIRNVFHLEIPGSLEAYYQEIGRAGRDGEKSHCFFFYDEDDLTIQLDFIKWSNPEPHFIKGIYAEIEGNPDKVNAEGLDYLRKKMNFYHTRDFRAETSVNLLLRYDCIKEGDPGYLRYEALSPPAGEFVDPTLHQKRLMGQNKKLLSIMQLTKESGCLKKFVYHYFGLTSVDEECGMCSRCIDNAKG